MVVRCGWTNLKTGFYVKQLQTNRKPNLEADYARWAGYQPRSYFPPLGNVDCFCFKDLIGSRCRMESVIFARRMWLVLLQNILRNDKNLKRENFNQRIVACSRLWSDDQVLI